MNKKVSTLVAALMAAGALVLPKDVFAQVAYANGKTYADQNAITEVATGNYYLVITDGEGEYQKDYVVVVNPNGKGLLAKDFAAAALSDMITLETGNQENSYYIKSGAKYLRVDDFDATEFVAEDGKKSLKVDFKGEQIKINGVTNGYVSRDGIQFTITPGDKLKNSGFFAKALDLNALKELTVDGLEAMSNSSEVSDGDAVILMYGDKVLAWDADAKKAVLTDYVEDEPVLWTLDIDDVDKTVRFKDANGKYLLNDAGNDYIEINVTPVSGKDGVYTISGSWDAIAATGVGVAGSGSIAAAAVPERDMTETTTDLNTWYNGKGFNFDVDGENVEGNLFGGENVVYSLTLDKAYSLTDKNYSIPAGTYFFTDVKFLNDKGAADKIGANDIDWLNSTLIAVSSTETNEATDTDRKNGKGFELVEVLGSDFDFQTDDDKFQGSDLAITNAAFKVTKNSGKDYPYAITLPEFTYQAKGTDYETEDQKVITNVQIGVESYTNDATTSCVVTKTGSLEYVFKFGNSAVLNVRTLLKDTKEAAVYTIQFVDGVKADKNLMDKYLTVGMTTSTSTAFQYEAKPEAIFDSSLPIFQWVISNVTDGEKNKDGEMEYKTVTFTNRETGKTVTTRLFTEGDGLYSMDTKELRNVMPYSIEEGAQNTYEVTPDAPRTVNSNVIIKLNPVTVDEYAGFLNVEDETIRTLAFARDRYTTSNRLFASVVTEYKSNGDVKSKSLNKDDEFVNEVVDAAQWQLLKVEQDSIAHNFIYNNTETKSADKVNGGDKVKANIYALRLVEDGSETDFFLADATRTLSKVTGIDESEDMKGKTDNLFLIKENVDGSVSLISYDSQILNGSKVAAANEPKSIDVSYSKKYKYTFDGEYAYDSKISTDEVRVYLDNEYSEISWPAEEGHVTLLSQMDNYITKNDDNDAIEVEDEPNVYYLHVTDKKAVVPSFYISLGTKEGSTAESERLYMFNPADSVNYYVADGTYDKKYQWSEEETKLIFKSATMGESRDTLTTSIKGEEKQVAMKADNNSKNVLGGLQRFKFQIVETADGDSYYYIRQAKADKAQGQTMYLTSRNSKMTFTPNKTKAMLFHVEGVEAPTANEGVTATEVKVIAVDGAINIKNAAGKNVVVSTILGQIVANEVLTSDNATISVPAGIAIVSVDGEEAVKVSVR